MRKALFIFILVIIIFPLYANNVKVKLHKGVIIVNKDLLEIIENIALPKVLSKDECVHVYMVYDASLMSNVLYIQIRLRENVHKKEWRDCDGVCEIDGVLIMFENCKKLNLIKTNRNPTPINIVAPSDFQMAIEDYPSWHFQFKKNSFILINKY